MKNDLPVYLFHQGTNYRSYDFLGSHFGKENGKSGVFFRVYAPHAYAVSVVGDFNGWDETKNPMTKISDQGVYETFVEGLKEYDSYKYAVKSAEKWTFKADPYAFHAETSPQTASKVYELDGYAWKDGKYMDARSERDVYSEPVNIYEVNLGSWKRHENGDYYTYREYASELVAYLKKMNYTHVELMPITEFPFDGSWGYQVTGYFAVTSRFGTPHDFMYFVDECHKAGIGVILDWVPAHFPKDEHGLYMFDGTCCYEYSDERLREHKGWGTCVFDFGKNEVQSFLISSATFFFDKYHIDGLRVDAVASMLYLDYDRKDGEWIANDEGGNINKAAVALLRKTNSAIFGSFAGVMMIAEESTAFPLVTAPVCDGGLGFNFKWNMGWMNDVLSYVSTDPYFRGGCHNKMTFSMMYAFSENFILPVSHDEVVHGKAAIVQKMWGADECDKYAQARVMYLYMFTHPGKKLNFMGNELGQLYEWSEAGTLDWALAERPFHRFFHSLCKTYVENPALHADYAPDNFRWAENHADAPCVFGMERRANGETLLALCNFADSEQKFTASLPKFTILLDSNAAEFGGTGETLAVSRKDSLCTVALPRYSAVLLKL